MQSLSGMLVINKPRGVISKDVSRIISKRFGKQLKLGHVGTLDPAADGLLPVLIGTATRLQDMLLDMPKTYRFSVAFGYETDTLDLEGQIIKRSSKTAFTKDDIDAVLDRFRGSIEQAPPLYSAVKVKGKPLYRYARSSKDQDIPDPEQLKRRVSIYRLDLIECRAGLAFFEVHCSKGTYVRSLGRDIAYALGSCATLTGISRIESAGVNLSKALQLSALESMECLSSALIPLEDISTGLNVFKCPNNELASKLKQGQKLLVSIGLFAKPLGELFKQSTGAHLPRSLFIYDEQEKALGVGELTMRNDDKVEIHMTRGLFHE